MRSDIEINLDEFNDYIGLEIFYKFFNINLIRKNIFQFIELTIAKIIIF